MLDDSEEELEDYWRIIRPPTPKELIERAYKRSPSSLTVDLKHEPYLRMIADGDLEVRGSVLLPVRELLERVMRGLGGSPTRYVLDRLTGIAATADADPILKGIQARLEAGEARTEIVADMLYTSATTEGHLALLRAGYADRQFHRITLRLDDIVNLVRSNLLTTGQRREQAFAIDGLLKSMALHRAPFLTVVMVWSGSSEDATLLKDLCSSLMDKIVTSDPLRKTWESRP